MQTCIELDRFTVNCGSHVVCQNLASDLPSEGQDSNSKSDAIDHAWRSYHAGHLRSLTTCVAHVLPVSDDGGSTAEIVRVLGGPAVGDIRSRCLRLADDSNAEVRAEPERDLMMQGCHSVLRKMQPHGRISTCHLSSRPATKAPAMRSHPNLSLALICSLHQLRQERLCLYWAHTTALTFPRRIEAVKMLIYVLQSQLCVLEAATCPSMERKMCPSRTADRSPQTESCKASRAAVSAERGLT